MIAAAGTAAGRGTASRRAAFAYLRYESTEDTADCSIKKFVKTVRRHRTIHIQASDHAITAADPLADDVHQILEAIETRAAAH